MNRRMICNKKRLQSLLFLGFLFLSIPSVGQMLIVGDRAPAFNELDSKGNSISLKTENEVKTLLTFFRYTSCPACNYRMHQLMSHYDSIQKKGFRVIAVFESSNARILEYMSDNSVPFPVIGDPELRLYKMYGVQKSFWRMVTTPFRKKASEARRAGNELYKEKKYLRDGNRSRMPADFIIDSKGIIEQVHYGRDISDHLPLHLILGKEKN